MIVMTKTKLLMSRLEDTVSYTQSCLNFVAPLNFHYFCKDIIRQPCRAYQLLLSFSGAELQIVVDSHTTQKIYCNSIVNKHTQFLLKFRQATKELC